MARRERRLAEALGRRLLDGAGVLSFTRIDPSEGPTRVVHVRRPVTPAERERLPRAWLEAPAVDGAGEGGHLDAIAALGSGA